LSNVVLYEEVDPEPGVEDTPLLAVLLGGGVIIGWLLLRSEKLIDRSLRLFFPTGVCC
jgi:hypothetical protein